MIIEFTISKGSKFQRNIEILTFDDGGIFFGVKGRKDNTYCALNLTSREVVALQCILTAVIASASPKATSPPQQPR
jgi:hypothetical protein